MWSLDATWWSPVVLGVSDRCGHYKSAAIEVKVETDYVMVMSLEFLIGTVDKGVAILNTSNRALAWAGELVVTSSIIGP